MPAESIPVDTRASKASNSIIAANAPMRAPPMTMLKKAMVMASKKMLNSSSGWGIERSVSGEGLVAAALLVPSLTVSDLVGEVASVLAGGEWSFGLAESAFEPG